MQQAVETRPSPSAASFAGLLASLAAPAPKPAATWNDDDLADDIATLSYERALRTHARYQSPGPGDWPSFESADRAAAQGSEASPAANTASSPVAPDWSAENESVSALGRSSELEKNKKCASITIRMSKTECVQLRRRAAEAGLTVSAYLRSCTFEAEALRAQVKETLAELRKATAAGKPAVQAEGRRSWFGWLFRLSPQMLAFHRTARTEC